jgi:hypothetical protein
MHGLLVCIGHMLFQLLTHHSMPLCQVLYKVREKSITLKSFTLKSHLNHHSMPLCQVLYKVRENIKPFASLAPPQLVFPEVSPFLSEYPTKRTIFSLST